MYHSSTIHSIVDFERIKVVSDFLSQSKANRQTSNLNKSASTDRALPFSLISNTLEGRDTLRLVLLNNTATQSQHIIAVHLLHCSSPALLSHLKRLYHFQSLEDRHKEQALFKGPIVEPSEIIQLVNLAPDLVSQ